MCIGFRLALLSSSWIKKEVSNELHSFMLVALFFFGIWHVYCLSLFAHPLGVVEGCVL